MFSIINWLQLFFLRLQNKKQTSEVLTWRRQLLETRCRSLGKRGRPLHNKQQEHFKNIFVDDRKKLMACLIPKVGCTNGRRVFLYLAGVINKSDVYSLDGKDVQFMLRRNISHLRSYSDRDRTRILKDYTKLIIVRNPFERFVSGYVNKLFHPDNRERDRFLDRLSDFYSANRLKFSHAGKIVNRTISFTDWAQFIVDKVPTGMSWMLISPLILIYVIRVGYTMIT